MKFRSPERRRNANVAYLAMSMQMELEDELRGMYPGLDLDPLVHWDREFCMLANDYVEQVLTRLEERSASRPVSLPARQP